MEIHHVTSKTTGTWGGTCFPGCFRMLWMSDLNCTWRNSFVISLFQIKLPTNTVVCIVLILMGRKRYTTVHNRCIHSKWLLASSSSSFQAFLRIDEVEIWVKEAATRWKIFPWEVLGSAHPRECFSPACCSFTFQALTVNLFWLRHWDDPNSSHYFS